MSGSGRTIHYVQRPGKNIERKMLVEYLARMDRITPLEEWQYVGFGSFYFADFALVHRRLGVTAMTNIEITDTPGNRDRFAFNVPFDCVRLLWGPASSQLAEIDWQRPTALWLDYDGGLDHSVIGDITHVVASCVSPIALVVSMNAESRGPNDEVFADFAERVGADRLPEDAIAGDVGGWGLAELSYDVLTSELAGAIADRQGASPENGLSWHQHLHFRYSDGAQMLTVGGVLVPAGSAPVVESANFEQLFFHRPDGEAFRIRVPNLTMKEVLHLASQMPSDDLDALDHCGIPPSDLRDYAEAYRYFPSYLDADV